MPTGRGSGRLALAVVLLTVLLAPVAGGAGSTRPLTPYTGVGTWVDIYVKKAWRHPERQVAAMARVGARTLYLETGNYRQKSDLVRPRILGRFLDAAHAAGLRVVAWYLPSFVSLRKDERRALAAIHFRSSTGEHFDSFALDIEATLVRPIPLRNRRLRRLSARLRSDVGRQYALGAIVPSPIGMSPTYWPGIPYRALARSYDVFLPMAYSTMRGVHGRNATRDYLAATVAAVRRGTGNPDVPVHLIGGIGGAMGAGETAGFMKAVAECVPLGFSLYEFSNTRRAAWTALTAPVPARPAAERRCT